jgi:hypothetical protein
MEPEQFPCEPRDAAPTTLAKAPCGSAAVAAIHPVSSADRRLALRAGCLGLGALAVAPMASAFTYTQRPAYRAVAARHVYDVHRQRIFKGKLPPLLYAIAVTETVVDANGKVLSARVIRQPAAAREIGPWVVSLIRAASPFPKPGSRTRFTEIWLVDKSRTFQLDSLTEGQLEST